MRALYTTTCICNERIQLVPCFHDLTFGNAIACSQRRISVGHLTIGFRFGCRRIVAHVQQRHEAKHRCIIGGCMSMSKLKMYFVFMSIFIELIFSFSFLGKSLGRCIHDSDNVFVEEFFAHICLDQFTCFHVRCQQESRPFCERFSINFNHVALFHLRENAFVVHLCLYKYHMGLSSSIQFYFQRRISTWFMFGFY